MKSRLAFVVLVVFVARPLAAQPIHGGCPNYQGVPITAKTAWVTPAEYPTLSDQIHAGGPGYNSMPSMLAHSHGDLGFGYCGEYGAEFVTLPYSQTLFMTQGRIDRIEGAGPNGTGNVVSYTVSRDPFAFRAKWLGIVTATANHPAWPMPTNTTGYPLIGNDSGVAIIEGEVTLDLGYRYNGITNGWTDIEVVTRTTYDSGNTSFDLLRLPFWTTVDPTAPMYYATPRTAVETHTVSNFIPTSAGFGFGSNSVFELSALPVFGDPITADHPVTVIVDGYAYTATQSNFSRNLVDANLHAGSLGIIYGETTHGVTSGSLSELDVTFPGGLSPGIHSDLAQWEIQGPPSVNGSPDYSDIQEWANLKFFFVIGAGGPPPPPPPVLTFQIVPGVVLQLFSDGVPQLKFEACPNSASTCTAAAAVQ